jgi:hypothetical protein
MSHAWRAIAVAVAAFLAAGGPLSAAERVGVAGVATPISTATLPGAVPRALEVGRDVHFREVIRTSDSGAVQVMFLDRSAFNVGPNSEVAIDEFVYDPATGAGRIAARAAFGVMRFVGGRLSKTGQVTIQTPTATLGIRGGIMLVEVDRGGATRATFLFGQQMTVTSMTGATQVVRQVGYQVSVPNVAAPPTPPVRVPPQQLMTQMTATEPPPPTSPATGTPGTGQTNAQATPQGAAAPGSQGGNQQSAGLQTNQAGGQGTTQAADRPPSSQLPTVGGTVGPNAGVGAAQGVLPSAAGLAATVTNAAANPSQAKSGQTNAGRGSSSSTSASGSGAAQAGTRANAATAGGSPFAQRVNAALSPQAGRTTPAFAPTLRPVAGVRPPSNAGVAGASASGSATDAATPGQPPVGLMRPGVTPSDFALPGGSAAGAGGPRPGALGDVTRNVVNLAPRGGQSLPPRAGRAGSFPKTTSPVAPGRVASGQDGEDGGRHVPRVMPPQRPVVRAQTPVAPRANLPMVRPGTPHNAIGGANAATMATPAPSIDAAAAAQAAARAAEMIQRAGIGRSAADATRRSSAVRAPAAPSSGSAASPQ